jgi:nicotinate-nucleotide adenylyltransferase
VRLAILGGSFNPIHLGHLFLADTVLSDLHYDRVALVPACRSPFKLDVTGMEDNAHERLQMAAVAIAGDPRLTVDDCEIRRGGVSYTVDTIADIIRRYIPEGKPGLIIGDDLAEDFPKWRNSEQILAMVDIIIARRINSGKPEISYPCTYIENDIMEISSKLIREKIAEGGAWRSLVPPVVRTIIEGRGLYAFEKGVAFEESATSHETAASREHFADKNLILRVEEAAREALNFERFLHSRNTALMAWDLCRRFSGSTYNLNPELGYLAGIAHDLGKPLSEKELYKLVKNDGRGISRLEKEKPSLLHGRAAAVLLRERFNVHNETVLEAVALHTAGGSNMGPLAKVVYVADKMEVSRGKGDPELRKLVCGGDNLEVVFLAVLNQTVSWLRSKKLKLSEDTVKLLEKTKGIAR